MAEQPHGNEGIKREIPWKETSYKKFFLEESDDQEKPPTLHIELKDPFKKQGLTQEQLVEWTEQIKHLVRKYDVDQFFPGIDAQHNSNGKLQMDEEYIEGTDFDVYSEGDVTGQLNTLIKKLIPMIGKHGFTFDIRSDNLKIDEKGNLKQIDLLPVISKEATAFSLGVARDPYAFLLEHCGGMLDAKNLQKLARLADISLKEREYWTILADDRRQEERVKKKGEMKKFSLEEIEQIGQDIVEVLQESPVVKYAGAYGSLARRQERVNDLDLFVVVDNETFRKIVALNKQVAFRKKYMRSIFYTPLEKSETFLKLPAEKKQKIAERRKISTGAIDDFVQMHMVALPENFDDPDIERDFFWVVGQQPDAMFFANILKDAQTAADQSGESLRYVLGWKYEKMVRDISYAEKGSRANTKRQVAWDLYMKRKEEK